MQKQKPVVFKVVKVMGIARIAERFAVLRAPEACSNLKASQEPSALSGSIPITFFIIKKQAYAEAKAYFL